LHLQRISGTNFQPNTASVNIKTAGSHRTLLASDFQQNKFS